MQSVIFFWLLLGAFTLYPFLLILLICYIHFTSKWFDKLMDKVRFQKKS